MRLVCLFDCWSTLSETSLLKYCSKDLPNFLQDCRGQWGASFYLHVFSCVFLTNFLIADYRGLSVKEWCFCGFSPKWSYDGSILACLFDMFLRVSHMKIMMEKSKGFERRTVCDMVK